MPTPVQIRAGRALLHWSINDLADRAGVGPRTIGRIERAEDPKPEPETVEKILDAFHEAGVDFWLDGHGVVVRLTC